MAGASEPVRAKTAGQGTSAGSELSPTASARATLDMPPRAIMMIRAYRMRGHLAANLDPLGLADAQGRTSELDPATYGFTEADFDRPIFLDYVLGLETSTMREILRDPAPHLLRQHRRAVHAHLRSRREGLDAGAHRGPRQGDHLHPRGKRAILKKLIEAEGFERFCRQVPRHQALRPRRRRGRWSRRWSRSSSAAARSA